MQSACAQALGCSISDLQPDLSTWASTCEQFSTLNGKHTQQASWGRAWKKEAYIQRLYGSAISPSSQQQIFEDWWIASLRDSHAKTSASPVGVPGLTANAPGSSSTSSTLPTLAVRGSCFWRTSQASLLPPQPLWTKLPPPKLLVNPTDLPEQEAQALTAKFSKRMALYLKEQPPESWENWPTAGGMRNGSLFQRPTWVPAMGGKGGSALRGDNQWMTPNVPNGGRHVPPELVASKGMTEDGQKRTVGLESQSKYWATPDCNTSTYSNGMKGPNLREQANTWPTPMAGMGENSHGQISGDFRRNMDLILTENWPTPRSTDGTKVGPNQAGSKGDLMLPSAAAQWPTPAARDAKGANSEEHCTVTGGGRKHMDQLSNFVAHSSHPALQTQPGPESSSTSPTLPRRLLDALIQCLESGSWAGQSVGPATKKEGNQ